MVEKMKFVVINNKYNCTSVRRDLLSVAGGGGEGLSINAGKGKRHEGRERTGEHGVIEDWVDSMIQPEYSDHSNRTELYNINERRILIYKNSSVVIVHGDMVVLHHLRLIVIRHDVFNCHNTLHVCCAPQSYILFIHCILHTNKCHNTEHYGHPT